MGSTGMLIAGGLLQGLGKGLVEDHEARRIEALARLKNEWDKEASATDFANKRELVDIGVQGDIEKAHVKGEEDRLTRETDYTYDSKLEGVKAANDKALAKLNSTLRMTEDQAKVAADLSADITKAGKIVDHWEVTADGRLVGLSATGHVISKSVNPGSFTPKGASEDSEDGATIKGAADRRGDSGERPAAKPKGPATGDNASEINYGFSAEEVTKLSGLYANATPQSHPQLFKDGKKIPFRDMLRMMK
jgi:hypothetical protein